MSESPDFTAVANTVTVIAGDGYPLAVHRFEPQQPSIGCVVLLHGVVSHAEWLTPIAQRLAAQGLLVICPDRRGTGRNTRAPGDAPDGQTLIDDVVSIVGSQCPDDVPLHLGGFCWGATYMINVMLADTLGAQTLIMIAPSIFPATDVAGAELHVGDSAEATEVPNVPIDRFTDGPAYEAFIVPDTRRTHYVSPRFNSILVQMNRMLAPRWAKLGVPTLMVLAQDDRLSDSDKHARAFATLRVDDKRCVILAGQHGLQFDAPDATADAICAWVKRQ
ncbi:MAG: alpha/beta fold hydrolase [Pseudomonadota bacterium]